MQVIQRTLKLPDQPRGSIMTVTTEPIDLTQLPDHIVTGTDLPCPNCPTRKSQWYIMAVKQKTGINNGAMPGLKCNFCKENFLRQYLHQNWVMDGSSSVAPTKTWQPYGLIHLADIHVLRPT